MWGFGFSKILSRGYPIHAAMQENGRYDFLTCLCLGDSNQIQLSFLFFVFCFPSSLSYLLFMGIFFGSVAGEIDSKD